MHSYVTHILSLNMCVTYVAHFAVYYPKWGILRANVSHLDHLAHCLSWGFTFAPYVDVICFTFSVSFSGIILSYFQSTMSAIHSRIYQSWWRTCLLWRGLDTARDGSPVFTFGSVQLLKNVHVRGCRSRSMQSVPLMTSWPYPRYRRRFVLSESC